MRFFALSILTSVEAGLLDPCAVLCQHDGPAVCTGGSWTKPGGVCHAYVFRGDPRDGDYCYHTAATADVCPSAGRAVLVADVARLMAPRQDALSRFGSLVTEQHDSADPPTMDWDSFAAALTDRLVGIIEALRASDLQPLEKWERIAGRTLLDMSLAAPGSAGSMLSMIGVKLALNLEPDSGSELALSHTSGLMHHCEIDSANIRASMLASQSVTAARAASAIEEELRAAFAADLPLYCPSLFEEMDELSAVVLRHRALRHVVRTAWAVPATPVVLIEDDNFGSLECIAGDAVDLRGGLANIPEVEKRRWFASASRAAHDAIFRPVSTRFSFRDRFDMDFEFAAPARRGPDDRHVRAAGRLLALAMVERVPLDVELLIGTFAQIAGRPLTFAEVEREDPALFSELRHLQPFAHSNETADQLRTRLTGTQAVIIHRVELLRQGFTDLIPWHVLGSLAGPGWLKALRLAVSGERRLDADDFLRNVHFLDDMAQDEQVVWFRRAVIDNRLAGLAGLLRPLTIQRHVQIGGFGFDSPVFIRRSLDGSTRIDPVTRTFYIGAHANEMAFRSDFYTLFGTS